MSIRRDSITRNIEARKSSVPTIGNGKPSNSSGSDGDLTFRRESNELKLYIKARGKWHGVKVGESFDDLEKTLDNLKRIVSTIKQFRLPSTYNVTGDFTLDSSGDIELNADGGQVSIKDGSSSHFLFDCDGTRFAIYDDTDAADLFKITVAASGVTTIATVDAGAAVGHLTLQPDGDLILDPASQKTIINATDGLYLDGGGNTYIYEVSTDTVRHVVGGDVLLLLTEMGTSGNTVHFSSSSAGFTQLEPTFDATDTEVDFRHSNKQKLTLTGNITDIHFQFPNMSGNFLCVLLQDGTGSWDVTNWKTKDYLGNAGAGNSGVVLWAGATAPALTETADKADIVSIYWDADNEIAYGTFASNF